MAARLRARHQTEVREKIKSSQLINRLTNHALGNLEKPMDASQVTAALGLLRKCVPDLSSTEIDMNADVTNRTVSAEPLSPEEWEAQYGGSLASAAGSAKGAH